MDPRTAELKLVSQNDNIFAGRRYPKPFAFNQEVAHVFDDMVRRSIPLYCDVTRSASDWIVHFYQAGSYIIDIGCSTGTLTHHVGQCLEEPGMFMAIDNSAAMIAKAEAKLKDFPSRHQLKLLCQDVMSVALPRCSAVIINYTLQFLPVVERNLLLARIYEALLPQGILILSEKVRSNSPAFQELTTIVYERFKEEQGYSKTEIERKKEALENVLIPYTEDEHRRNLKQVGFTEVESVMKWNNFVTLIAMKGPRP